MKVQSNIEQQLNSNDSRKKMVYVLSTKNVPLMPCTWCHRKNSSS